MSAKKLFSRRNFIKAAGKGAGLLAVAPALWRDNSITNLTNQLIKFHIYIAKDYGPGKNIEMIIDMMGGINNLIDTDDIVIIKTNAQHFNQGSPNLAAIKRYIELVIEMPNFKGEIIVADNNHSNKWPWLHGAWHNTFEINSDVPDVHNLNDLINLFQHQGYNNVTGCHWLDVDKGGKRVYNPADGDGSVYRTDLICDNAASGDDYRETIMTYPIFTSSYSSKTIDLANGVYQNGEYNDQPVKFINFAGLCSHGSYTGATSAIKNYLGVADLSGGWEKGGKLFDNYYNFHSFPFNDAGPGPVPGMLGREVGMFLKSIRPADLNITTAEWVGWEHRSDINKAAQTKTILACADPVTLDYYATKYLLYPAGQANNSYFGERLNPDRTDLPLRQYLEQCHAFGIGTLDEEEIEVHTIAPVPVNIISFSAKIVKNSVELSWTLGSTTDFYGFEIQKSSQDLHFYKMGFQELHNASSKVFYFWDKNISPGSYYYRLKLIDRDGKFDYSEIILVDMRNSKVFSLLQCCPNPFNNLTKIQYGVPKPGKVTLTIFDLKGSKINTLLDEEKNVGHYVIKWDGKDRDNISVPSGVYLCQMNMANFTQSIKIILVR